MVENVLVVKEFTDVFADDIPSLPPDQEIKFMIDLVLSTKPISIALYQMAPAELMV